MNLLRLVSAVLVSSVMVGCASTPKPVMSNEDYTKYAKTSVALSYCIQQGWINPSTAALGKRYLESNVHSYSVDFDRLNRETDWFNRQEERPNQGNCNELATGIHSRYQTIQTNNQAVEYNNQQTQQLLNSTKIRNTYCNQIGTSTICNTY